MSVPAERTTELRSDSIIIQQATAHLYGVDVALLSNETRCLAQLAAMCTRLGAHVVFNMSQWFGPGMTGIVVLSESHAAIHTWPEFRYAHVDIVTCSTKINLGQLEILAREFFKPAELQVILSEPVTQATAGLSAV